MESSFADLDTAVRFGFPFAKCTPASSGENPETALMISSPARTEVSGSP